MTTETYIGGALLRTPALLGIMALSVILALAAACGGDEQSQGEPTTTPTQVTRTPTPGGTPTVAKPTPTVAKLTATVARPTATVARPTTVAQATPTATAVVQVSVDDDPSWGPEDAAVTIVEFSDFL
jgi:protein-disulfide isomerase